MGPIGTIKVYNLLVALNGSNRYRKGQLSFFDGLKRVSKRSSPILGDLKLVPKGVGVIFWWP